MDVDKKISFAEHPNPMLILSEDQDQILKVNNAFTNRYWDDNTIVGRNLSDITQPLASDLIRNTSPHHKDFLSLSLPDGNRIMVGLTYKKIIGEEDQYYVATLEELFPPFQEEEALQHPIYKAIFDEARDIILVADDDGQFQQVNQTACKKLGYTREELLGMSVLDITYSPMESYGDKTWDEFLHTGTDEGEYLLVTKEGAVLYTEYRAVANIRPGKHLSILRDVSENKHIKNALKTSEDRFERLLNAVPDAVLTVNEEGNILYCNAAAEEMMGYEENELIGKPIEKLVPESIRENHVKYREEYTKNPHKRPMGSSLDLKAIRKDGTEVPVDIMLGPLKENGSLHVLAVVRDVSDFKQAQSQLQREKKFTKLLHSLTTVANQAASIDEALDKSIEQICNFMNWPVGHAYLPANDGTNEFYPTDNWYLEDPDRFRDFRNFTMGTRFSPGEGMVGKVISTGKPQWRKNVHKDPNFVRRLPNIDLQTRASLGFPILIEDKVVGVLEFFCSDVLDTDTLLLEKMATIGHQLGRVYERYEAEEKLKRSEEKFKTLFETAPNAILILDDDGLVNCNESACHLFQLSYEELSKSSLTDLFPHKQSDGSLSNKAGIKKIQKAFQGEDQFFEWRFLRADGTAFDAEVSLTYMKMNGANYVQVVLQDITERKKKDQLIEYNMKLFSNLFENAPVGLVMLNDHHTVQDINESFKEMFGYNLSEIRGKKVDNILAPDELKKEAEELTEKTLNGDSTQIETVRQTKNGEEIPVLIATVPVEITDEIVAIFGIYVDISKRKEAEQQLEKQLEEKRVLLAEIHHRVKNNLAVVSGLLELQKDHTENEEAYHKMKDSQARIQSMGLIHEQLYQMEFYSSLQFDKYVESLVGTIASSYASETVDIEINYDTEPVELGLNPAISCGLLLNELVTNAFKHAFTGMDEGTITISVYEKKNNLIVLKVADNGVGIPKDIQERGSSSLGFTLIQTLSQQLGGNLEVLQDNGSTFIFTFEKIEP